MCGGTFSAVMAKVHSYPGAGWGFWHCTVAVGVHHVNVGDSTTPSALAVHNKLRPLDSWWHSWWHSFNWAGAGGGSEVQVRVEFTVKRHP